MSKVTVEIEDDLFERIDGVMDEIKDILVEAITDDPEAYQDFDEFLDKGLQYDGTINELVDSATPIYTSEIKGLFYLYESELVEAYNNAGIYDKPPENFEQVCIYCYIEQEVYERLQTEIAPVFEEWLELKRGRTAAKLKSMLRG